MKAFNTVFAQHMDSGQVKGEKLTVLAAGDDATAKETVLRLAKDIGFDAVDAGGLQNARLLEPLALQISVGHSRPAFSEMVAFFRSLSAFSTQPRTTSSTRSAPHSASAPREK